MKIRYILGEDIIKTVRNGDVPRKDEAITLTRKKTNFPFYRVKDVVRQQAKNQVDVVLQKIGVAERIR